MATPIDRYPVVQIAGATGALAGGLVGFIDLQEQGAAVGAFVGLLAGLWLGGTFRCLVGLCFLLTGPAEVKPVPESGSSVPPTAVLSGNRGLAKAVRVLVLAVLFVLAHESYWLLNIVSLAMSAAQPMMIGHMIAAGASKEQVKRAVEQPRASAFLARPLCWFLTPNVLAVHQTAIEMNDCAADKENPDVLRRWRQQVQDGSLATALNADPHQVQELAADPLAVGLMVFVVHTEKELRNAVARTWIIKRIPSVEEAFLRRPDAAAGLGAGPLDPRDGGKTLANVPPLLLEGDRIDVKVDPGLRTHDIVLTNNSDRSLTDVNITCILVRKDDSRFEKPVFWGEWGRGEKKAINVPATGIRTADFGVAIKGTAVASGRDGRTQKITIASVWELKRKRD